MVHLAADYNSETDRIGRGGSTSAGPGNVCGAAEAVGAGTLHRVSSIVAAGWSRAPAGQHVSSLLTAVGGAGWR